MFSKAPHGHCQGQWDPVSIMALFAQPLKAPISEGARRRRAAQQTYPTLESWMNPLTRGIARHFAHQSWLNTHKDLDFDYRLTDIEIGDVPCMLYETSETAPDDRVILYVHGGALVAGSPRVNASMILPTCKLSGVEAIGVDYTLLPEGRFPKPQDDVDNVYKALLAAGEKKRIVLFGDSAGGLLILANLLRWRDEGTPLPKGAVFISPMLDGAGVSDTHKTLDGHDPLIKSQGGKTSRRLFNYYAPGEDLTRPEISPIYGKFHDLPPMLVHAGTREVVLGEAARLSEYVRRDGGDLTLRLFDGMFHLFQMHWSLEEAKSAHEDIAAFVKNCL